MKKTVILVCVLLFAFSQVYAVFNDYIPSARARGMGNAYIAGVTSPDAIFYNPACLHFSTNGVTAGYAKGFGLDFFVLKTGAFKYVIPKIGTFAMGIKTMDCEYQDVVLQSEGTYSIAQSFLLIGDVHSELFLGYALNMYYLQFSESVSGMKPGEEMNFGVDLGAVAILHQRTKIAFAVKNLNNPVIGEEQTEDLPQSLIIGVAYEPYEGVTTEINLKQKFSEKTEVHFGFEYQLINNFWLRTGASTYPNSFSGGFGLLVRGVKFDYGFGTHPVLDVTHHFSLGYQF